MTIVPLAERPEFLELLAAATGREWAHLYSGWGAGAARAELLGQDPCGVLPVTFVAVVDGRCAGTVSLIRDDLPGYRPVHPWLASLWVLPDFRGRGLATALIRRAEDHLSAHGYREAWAFTESAQSLFARCGWELVEPAQCHGVPVQVLRKELGPAQRMTVRA
jgi:GNAT superfamily N-acetyltransferase